jgi:hypothetical protein
MEVTAKEVEALFASAELDHTGLVRVEAETELTHDRSRLLLSLLGCALVEHITTKSSA